MTVSKLIKQLSLGTGLMTLTVPLLWADTLESALVSAYQNNTEIKEAIERLKAANEREAQARAGWRPTVTVDAQVSRSDQNISGDQIDLARNSAPGSGFSAQASKQGTSTQQASITAQQNIFQGGATKAAIERAKADINAARASLKEVEQRVLLDTIKAYVNLMTGTKQVEFLKANAATKQATLKATKDKFNVGEETRTSVSQAEADQADATARVNSAQAELSGYKATYERLTNKSAGVLAKIEAPKSIPASVQAAIDKAIVNHPSIIKTRFEETSVRRQIDQINGGQLPKIDLFASSTRSEQGNTTRWQPGPLTAAEQIPSYKRNNTDNQIGLKFNWVLYDGGVGRAQKRENAHNAEQKRLGIESARRQIEEQLKSAYELYNAAKSNVTFYTAQVSANRLALDGTEQELKVGSKILLDVLNAQSRLVESQLNLVRAENQLFQAAYQIVALMGLLTAQDMKLKVDVYNVNVHYEDVRYRW